MLFVTSSVVFELQDMAPSPELGVPASHDYHHNHPLHRGGQAGPHGEPPLDA